MLLIGVYNDEPQEALTREDLKQKLLASPFAGVMIFDSKVQIEAMLLNKFDFQSFAPEQVKVVV